MGGERTADRSRFPALIRHRGRSPSRRFADHTALVLPGHRVRGFFAHAFPDHDDEQLRDPSLSPLFAKQVAGNRADLDVRPDGVHGFNNVVPKTGHAVVEGISSWFNARLSA